LLDSVVFCNWCCVCVYYCIFYYIFWAISISFGV